MSKLTETNWTEKLEGDETKQEDGKTVVFLKGLRRLAWEAGLVKSVPRLSSVVTSKSAYFQCMYTVGFATGEEFGATADTSELNLDQEPYSNYPTACAESRAEARALKKALRIDYLAFEEISGTKKRSKDKIDAGVAKAIGVLIKELNFNPVEVFEKTLEPNRRDNVFSFDDLTADEGRSIMKFLNDSRGKAKKGSKK